MKWNFSFSDIKFNLEGDTLIVTVEERKIVQNIILNGVPAEKTKKLILKNLSIKEKSPYVNFLAQQDIKKIKNALNSAGYYFNKVEVSMQTKSTEIIETVSFIMFFFLILLACVPLWKVQL